MRGKRILSMALALLLLTGTLTGCGGGQTAEQGGDSGGDGQSVRKVRLVVWGPQEDQVKSDEYSGGILKEMCDRFNEAHPEWDITFEYGVCSEGDAKDVVTKDVTAAADVYMYANDQIPILTKAGALARLGGAVAEAVQVDNDQTMVDSVTYEGGIYGVPFTSNTWFMYYDKSKFDGEEIKSLNVMMDKDLGKNVVNFAFPLDNSWYIPAFYYAAGGELFGKDGSDAEAGCTFDSDRGIAMTKFLAALAKNKRFSNEKEGSSIARFKRGTLGAYCSGSWDAAAIREALGKNFGVAVLPRVTVDGSEGQMRSFAGSKAIGVNPMCENPDVAVALAAYLGNRDCQEMRFSVRDIIPTNKELLAGDEVKKDEVAMVQAAEINSASVVQPVNPAMDNYWTPAETMGRELVQGDVTEANAGDKTKAMVKGITTRK